MRISDWSSDVCSSDLLPQAHFQDVFCLPFRQVKAFHQRSARLIGFAYGLDDFIHIQIDHHAPFQHMDAISHLVQAELSAPCHGVRAKRSEEHTSELQSLMRISYAVFYLKKRIIPSS